MKVTTFAFVRHGVTDWNLAWRAQGHHDIPLNDSGRQQADAVGKRFSEEHWDVLYSSPLSRAKDTAEAITKYSGLPITKLDERMKEINMGLIESTTEEERVQKWGANWRQLELGRESAEAIHSRGMAFIEDCLIHHAGQKIIVVSHGGLISHLLRMLFHDKTMDGGLLNTSVSVVTHQDGSWLSTIYNCTKHL